MPASAYIVPACLEGREALVHEPHAFGQGRRSGLQDVGRGNVVDAIVPDGRNVTPSRTPDVIALFFIFLPHQDARITSGLRRRTSSA